jgi:hypothetical protein
LKKWKVDVDVPGLGFEFSEAIRQGEESLAQALQVFQPSVELTTIRCRICMLGPKSCNLPIPPQLSYHNAPAGIDRLISLADFASNYQLAYVVTARDDFYRDLHEPVRLALEASGCVEQCVSSR